MSYIESNKGIKCGDIFTCSWGYEQTNVDFFKVEKIRGTKQVLLREVTLASECVTAHSAMSGDFKYDPKRWQYVKNSVFIDDDERGKIATVKRNPDGGFVHSFMDGRHLLTPYHGETLYESWYA